MKAGAGSKRMRRISGGMAKNQRQRQAAQYQHGAYQHRLKESEIKRRRKQRVKEGVSAGGMASWRNDGESK